MSETEGDPDTVYSTLRASIVEHVFIGDLFRRLWERRVFDVEVLRGEIDAGGYDVVFRYGKIFRHIQLKTGYTDGSKRSVPVNLKIGDKPSGCVIWIILTRDLKIDSFLWFGGLPGTRFPDIQSMRVTKQTRGPPGAKKPRSSHRNLPSSRFKKLKTHDEVLAKLFGDLPVALPLP
jgi:hypothetical protein